MKSSAVFVMFLSACDTVWSSTILAPRVVLGTVGNSVKVHCNYSDGSFMDNAKYWCKGGVYELCTVVVKTTGPTARKRFSISESKHARVFSVTLSSLRHQDEGKYWCVISKRLRNIYAPVYLRVISSTDISPTSLPLDMLITRPQEGSNAHSDVWSILRWILFFIMLTCPLAVCLWKSSARHYCVTLCSRLCVWSVPYLQQTPQTG
ncbi:hypothetical protein AGOR_G00133780 [Albula goreensis]|uniref:Ig-like domain-containing protein n=1 Tax=Albula goreensis TaxID=1534307 RepID=A0A8T3D4F1_9TELE|nr:hypothetical protein AGOR_G00133780 [Albula goreensis]